MRLLLLLACLSLVACGSGEEKPLKQGKVADFKVITVGETVQLEEHALKGSITVFDFYADWCPPCKKLDLSLVDLKKVYGDRLEILKLDLVTWDSALATQFSIKDLPYLIVYGEDGKPLIDSQDNSPLQGPSNQVLPLLIAELNR